MPRSLKQRIASAPVPSGPASAGQGRGPSAPETAAYVAEMAGQLARLAAQARLDLLAHFLTMARIEAEAQAGEDAPPLDA